jgi:serine phosphatase RsbU (regulator of sigma subunit)
MQTFVKSCEDVQKDCHFAALRCVITVVKSIFNCTPNQAVESSGDPQRGSSNLLLKSCVTCGLLLGIGLLAQMIAAYRFVSNDLVQREAEHETNRKIAAVEQMARVQGSQDTRQLSQIVDAAFRESRTQIAWLRILQFDGTSVAAVGVPAEKLYSRSRIQQAIESHEILSKIVMTPSGRVLVTARPFHAEPGPFEEAANGEGRASSPEPLIVEIAVYLDSVAAPFGPLRARFLTGSMAAFALVIAMIVIGLRFRPYLRGKQLQRQADVARTVQLDLMPPMKSIPKDLDFAGVCIPAWQVGGDFYDVFADKHGRLGLMLTDVAGKGLPAALLSSLIQGVLRATSWTSDALAQAGTARQLNDFLCARSAPERFASMICCYYDSGTSTLRYVNAGHLPPMLVHRDQSEAFSVQRLEDGGPVLGLLPGSTYLQGEVAIGPGDLLVMFSDGVTEAEDASGEDFGEGRLLEAIYNNWDAPAHNLCGAVRRHLRLFLGGLEPQDDQTLMIIRLQPSMNGLTGDVFPAPGRSQAFHPEGAELLCR